MVFSGIAAHDQHTITIGQIVPVIGHRAASERLCQSLNSGAVSETRLVLDIHQAQSALHGLQGPAFLIVQSGGTQ